jgi:hypothetical protein
VAQKANSLSAEVGKDGLVHIRSGSASEFIAPLEKSPVDIEDGHEMQASIDQPIVVADGRTVGWLVNFPNCCTSYPIPLMVVFFCGGRIIRRVTPYRAVFKFSFVDGGRKAAYFMDTLHGNIDPECVLIDIESGKQLGHWRRGEGQLPSWAQVFKSDIGPTEENSP